MTNLEWVPNSEWVLIKHLLEKPRIIKYIDRVFLCVRHCALYDSSHLI